MMRALSLQVLVLLSLTVGAALLTWKFHPLAPALRLDAVPLDEGEVSIDDALRWEQEEGVLWIDARPEDQYEVRHIPGAILLNEFQFTPEAYFEIANSDFRKVVYCGTHSCKASTKMAELLREKKMPDVYVLKGGWDAWLQKAGGGG